MKIEFAGISVPSRGAIVVAVLEERVLGPTARLLDARTEGALSRAIATGRFKGKKGQQLLLAAPPGLTLDRILLYGLGKASEVDVARFEQLGGSAVAALNRAGERSAAIAVDAIEGVPVSPARLAAAAAYGARLGSYRFDKYRTKQKEDDKPTLAELSVLSDDPAAARGAYGPLDRIADGVFFTRDLVSEPGNVKYPETIAADIRTLSEIGVDVEIMGEGRLRELGMNALLGVGQGSVRESQVAVMRWNGAPDGFDQQPVCFVGKGVTFDTGGISIKPAAGMEEMKYDMAGAGAVIGVMKALAGRKAKLNAVGLVGLVENMPDGNAQRPGDVVTSMSGQTIEVVNTDAEGRLVLGDVLWYAHTTFKPKFIVDLATLTGAIVISLGTYQAGLFCNNDELAERLIAAGKAVDEPLWRMPLGEKYDKDINSDIADMKNVGKGREAGSVTAAQFLQRFVEDTPWAHLDIAGMAWMKNGDNPLVPKGASGYGVRLLERLAHDYYEAK
ncbi:MAG: leucyl aminopeptidase [Alphaproteobacteria bacterium]